MDGYLIVTQSRELITCLATLAMLWHCGSLERRNPADPAVEPVETPGPVISLSIPVPKPLVSVIDSMVAILEGPDMTPIEKEVDHSPLGPGLLTIGAIPPGSGRTLTIRGFDHDGQLVMEGMKNNITISEGDTSRITLNMSLAEGFTQEETARAGDLDPVVSEGETAGGGGG